MEIRAYTRADERGWLRCRVLSFLESAYFDDVLAAKPTYDAGAVELVAVAGDAVVGVLDVSVAGEQATIETIGVHPDQRLAGTATALLTEARAALAPGVAVLDAWTRDDEAANAWYQARGFAETFRYLHVYAKSDAELAAAVAQTHHALVPAHGFFHANLEDEAMMRATFARVYVCRRYALALT